MPGKFQPRDVTVLLLALLLGYLGLEYGSYWRMARPAGRGNRITTEYREALALRPVVVSNQSPTVLFVGNSLLREALEMRDLQNTLGPSYDVHRLILEGTSYDDWSLAIPALLQSGSQPDFLVLALSPQQMTSRAAVSLETIHYFLHPDQIQALSRDERGGPTGYVMHVIENVSPYWGTRNSAQSAFKDIIPGFRSVIFSLANGLGIHYPFDPERMKFLASVCHHRGVKFVYLALPENDPTGTEDTRPILAAANADGAIALRPLPDELLNRSHYSDQIHLNEKGRGLFTRQLGAALPSALESSTVGGLTGFSGFSHPR